MINHHSVNKVMLMLSTTKHLSKHIRGDFCRKEFCIRIIGGERHNIEMVVLILSERDKSEVLESMNTPHCTCAGASELCRYI